jgi:thiamine-monophosphate kinase
MRISSLGEFELIKRFLKTFPPPPENLLLPPGDDCAVIGIHPYKTLLVTTDMLVENVHFSLCSHTPEQLGRKAMAVNLSDIAAMGGIPLHAFLSLGLRKDTELSLIDGLATGMREMCERFCLSLSGGDMTGSPETMIINLCLIGEAPDNKYLTRSGALPGDLIQISGPLGGSAACLSLILADKSCENYPMLARAHFSPEPRIHVGRALNRIPGVHSMIDISDGLIQDIGHICAMSGTGAELYVESIPLFLEAELLAGDNRDSALIWAVSGGEDYELCWTVHPDAGKHSLEAAHLSGGPCPATIGRITSRPGIILKKNGKEWKYRSAGWDHFKQ